MGTSCPRSCQPYSTLCPPWGNTARPLEEATSDSAPCYHPSPVATPADGRRSIPAGLSLATGHGSSGHRGYLPPEPSPPAGCPQGRLATPSPSAASQAWRGPAGWLLRTDFSLEIRCFPRVEQTYPHVERTSPATRPNYRQGQVTSLHPGLLRHRPFLTGMLTLAGPLHSDPEHHPLPWGSITNPSCLSLPHRRSSFLLSKTSCTQTWFGGCRRGC